MDFEQPLQPQPSQSKGYVIAVIICIVIVVLTFIHIINDFAIFICDVMHIFQYYY